jgi:hypothetical protein
MAKTLIELPVYIIQPIFFTIIFYWMTNLNNDMSRFFTCMLIVILVTQVVLAYSQCLSAVIPIKSTASDFAGPLTLPFVIFSGYFLNNE